MDKLFVTDYAFLTIILGIDFNQMRWTREGCQICSLDLSSDPQRWREGVAVAIAEVQRLGRYGLTPGEIGE